MITRKKPTVWVGIIPEIFGYGITVVESSEARAMAALRTAYADWKEARPDPSTDFDSSFQRWGGTVKQVELGKGYYDNFGE